MRVRLAAAALVALLALPRPTIATVEQAAAAPKVEALLQRYLADAAVAGVSVGVERNGQVLVRGGWGWSERTARTATTADTIYRLGSASKQFTATLVMKLVERDLVGLDDPVDRHLPGMPRKWLGITVRQMLNHTSGVPDLTATGERHWPEALSPDGLLACLASSRSTPGSQPTRSPSSSDEHIAGAANSGARGGSVARRRR